MKHSFLCLQIWNKLVDTEKDSNLLTDDVVTSPQDFYKLNGKPVYVLVESRESDK